MACGNVACGLHTPRMCGPWPCGTCHVAAQHTHHAAAAGHLPSYWTSAPVITPLCTAPPPLPALTSPSSSMGPPSLPHTPQGPFHRDTTSWSPRMMLRATVRTALEIAHGMQHLHLSGLVHGDLKPGNVLLKVGWGEVQPTKRRRVECVCGWEKRLGRGCLHHSSRSPLGGVQWACGGAQLAQPPWRVSYFCVAVGSVWMRSTSEGTARQAGARRTNAGLCMRWPQSPVPAAHRVRCS